jgi:tripartite-type tricarboxylate transporter receptor subunit TctC
MAHWTTRRRFMIGAVAAPFVARSAFAQAFPSRPIRIVIGFPPGGGIDILARLMAPKMSERLGQAVIIDNRPGANGQIATQVAAQAEPDGHTILFGTTGNLAINQVLYAGRAGPTSSAISPRCRRSRRLASFWSSARRCRQSP